MWFVQFILIVLLNFSLLNCNDQDNQLIVIESEDSNKTNDGIANETPNDSPIKIFQATKEWKEVHDEILPQGLHVRINLQTGKKEAKLLVNEDELDVNSQVTTKYQIATKSSPIKNVILTEAEDRFLREINKLNKIKLENEKEKDKKIKSKTNKESFTTEIKSESEIMKRLLDKYNQTIELNEKLTILTDLEYLVHSIDVGKDFYDFGGFNILVKDLNQTKNDQLKIDILAVFGSAIQSNDYIKMELSKTNFLLKIISMLENVQEINVIRKCFFVLSTLLRNSASQQAKFFDDYGGVKLFKNLFNRDDKLAVKIATFLSDITSEISENDSTRSNYIDSTICLQIIHLLNHDLDKSNLILLLESMLSLTKVCDNQFKNNKQLIEEIHSKFKSEEFILETTEQLLKQLN